ncbi:N-acetyltransferase [Priestia aryabhattai]|uniref:N-acetyltransferase n=1 Tax=Priestia aryabhattai TaxID=412384 RepID=UPI001C8DCCEF|nr:N-acetyltransferase [Priestia aryabhattai]MBX9968379.1 N-acetyltransferase [Priestia aryabhattai]
MSNIPKSTKMGKYVVIEEGVRIGENVVIGHNTVILTGTKIGNNVEIGSNCVLGIQPSSHKKMRKINQNYNQLVIENNTRIGNMVSIYLGTLISENVFIGDHASIRENVLVEEGTVIGRAAIVELNSKIGKYCTIQTLVYVTGDTVIEDNVFIGPCVSMSNDKYMGAKEYNLIGPHIKKCSKIGNNATLLPGIRIGKDAVIGAGTVVTKDVCENETVVGIYGKPIKKG